MDPTGAEPFPKKRGVGGDHLGEVQDAFDVQFLDDGVVQFEVSHRKLVRQPVVLTAAADVFVDRFLVDVRLE